MTATATTQNILLADLHISLSSPLVRCLFARAITGCATLEEDRFLPPNFEAYFGYYRAQCQEAICDGPDSSKSHQDIVELAQHLAKLLSTEPTVVSNHDDYVYWKNFTVRVLTMIDVGELRQGIKTGPSPRTWSAGSLNDFMKQTFEPRVLSDNKRLEKLFNARNITRIAEINIRWTCNLADHLRLEDEDTAVQVFSHASFLELHQNSWVFYRPDHYEANSSLRDIFPSNFITETLQTLALLFPSDDKKVATWFRKEQKRFPISWFIDPHAMNLPCLAKKDHHTENFEFWHDRLVLLKQAFDEANPKSMQQLWIDRRQMAQWAYFWYAIILVVGVTVFFGLVQSVIGAMQVYKAYHPTSA